MRTESSLSGHCTFREAYNSLHPTTKYSTHCKTLQHTATQVPSTGRSRELSVRDAGHFERAVGVHEELLMEAGALCISAGVGESVYLPALCRSGQSLDPVQPEAVCRCDLQHALQHAATHCNMHYNTHCNTLQHTTTHYITLQQTAKRTVTHSNAQ